MHFSTCPSPVLQQKQLMYLVKQAHSSLKPLCIIPPAHWCDVSPQSLPIRMPQPTYYHRSISQQGLLVLSKAFIILVQLLQLLQCLLGRRFVVEFPIQLIIIILHMRFLGLLSHGHLVWVTEEGVVNEIALEGNL